MDDAYLISVVAKYEEIYNTGHTNYSNQQRRDKIWEEIGSIMKLDSYICKERWTRIRDNFRKALNLRRIKTGKAACKIKAPKFYKELSFLLPFIAEEDYRRPTRSGSDTEDDSIISSMQSNVRHSDRPSSPSPVTITYTPVYSPDCDIQSSTNANREQMYVTNQSFQENTSTYQMHNNLNFDPITDFFLTMAKTVKTFPIQDQLRVKAQLFQTVNNVELKLANSNETVRPSNTETSTSQIKSTEMKRAIKRERSVSDDDDDS